MAVAVGIKAEGNLVTPTQPQTLPGEIYRATIKVQSLIPITNYARISAAISKVKQQYPAVNVTYIEVDGENITMDFYDFPAVPWNLVLIAVIAALAVVGLVIVYSTVQLVLNAVPPELRGAVTTIAVVGGAVFLTGIGIAAALKYGGPAVEPLKGYARQAGAKVKEYATQENLYKGIGKAKEIAKTTYQAARYA